jgi:CBS domain-containing protein
MRVQEILRRKGDSVYQISPDATLADAVDRLVNFNIGSLLVSDGETIYGIITERDIMKVIADSRAPLSEIFVHAHMTRDMATGEPNDNVNDVMGTMTSRRIRHLPIMDNGRLAGMISIGDVVKAQHELLIAENHYLREYIQS